MLKIELIAENKRFRAALNKIDAQWNDWRWLGGPDSARIASTALRRPVTTNYGPGSILEGQLRTNWCIVGNGILPGSEMSHRPTPEEIGKFRTMNEY